MLSCVKCNINVRLRCYKLGLKPGGALFMSFPNRFVLQSREKCSYMRVLSRGGNKVEDFEEGV